MISIEIDSDNDQKSDKISTNFYENEFLSFASNKPAKWGIYPFKPHCQESWDENVKETIAAIIDDDVKNTIMQSDTDIRPKLFDARSGRWLLVDSGASLSIWP